MTARRDFLAFTAGAVAARTVLPLAARAEGNNRHDAYKQADAALIAACAEYLRIQWEFEAYCASISGDIEAGDPGTAMLDPLAALTDTIVAIRATTPEGISARGRCLAYHYLAHNKACQDDPDGAPDDRFKAALLRDLVRLERGMPA